MSDPMGGFGHRMKRSECRRTGRRRETVGNKEFFSYKITSLEQWKCCLKKYDLFMKNKLFYYYTTKLDVCKEIFCEFGELCLLGLFDCRLE